MWQCMRNVRSEMRKKTPRGELLLLRMWKRLEHIIKGKKLLSSFFSCTETSSHLSESTTAKITDRYSRYIGVN